MKPGFALSLSFEGISLLQRAAGGWRSIGEVSLEATDLAAELAGLRDKARAYGSDDIQCKIIVPNDQIRYLSVETGTLGGEARVAMVRKALDGATPYSVDDLAFDLSIDDGLTHIAAVAQETLAEAESFAVDHGFSPVSFVAIPGDQNFLGEPFFGPARHAAQLPGAPEVEPDGIAVVVIGPAITPESPSPPEPVVAPPAQPQTPEPTPAPGFTSRRRPKSADAADTPDNAPVESAASADPSPAPVILPSLGRVKHEPVPANDADSPSLAADSAPVAAPEPISVTAPTLDIPDSDAPADGMGGFLSRRRKPEPSEEATPAPFVPPAPAPLHEPDPFAESEPMAVSRPSDPTYSGVTPIAPPQDEAARMTVFGARDQGRIGGKPRHLGLILSAALLVFLAAIAAWASIFLDDGVAGLFRSAPVETELAAVPGTPAIGAKALQHPQSTTTDGEPPATAPDTGEATTPAQLPPASLDVPSMPAPRRISQPAEPPQPASPNLSDTDSAVLEALRQSEQQADLPPADISPETDPANQPETQPEDTAATSSESSAPPAIAGILQTAPQIPSTPSIIGLDDLYVASIDRTDLAQDAVALPTVASLNTDLPLGSVNSPVAAGTQFALGPGGLVKPTAQGTLSPAGVLVYLGRPASVPPARPTRTAPVAEPEIVPDRLASRRPQLRPEGLAARFERSNLGGLSRDELKSRRPKARPASLQDRAEPNAPATAQAVASSRVPRARPGNFAAIVSAAIRPTKPAKPGASTGTVAAIPTVVDKPRSSGPEIPSSASVARQATLRNEINLKRVNLIGVYGTPSNRRALVRLPSGRYKKVKVGDTVDGGRIVAIGDSELRYQKKGRNVILKIPSS